MLIIYNVELQNIDDKDYPDYVDAYISYAEDGTGRPLTEEELRPYNNDALFVYNEVLKHLYG